MLRLGPTVITLSRNDVSEVIQRRRLRRHLDCPDEDAGITLSPGDIGSVFHSTPSRSSPAQSTDRMPTPASHRVPGSTQRRRTRHSSPEDQWNALPLLEAPGRRGQAQLPQQNRDESSIWTAQLCLRPKRSLGIASTTAAIDGSSSSESRHSPVSSDLTTTSHPEGSNTGTPSTVGLWRQLTAAALSRRVRLSSNWAKRGIC